MPQDYLKSIHLLSAVISLFLVTIFTNTTAAAPSEPDTDYLMSLKREDAAVFTGVIVDNNTGLPLARVQVSSKNSKASASSDDQGRFILVIPVPSSTVQTGQPIPDDIVFKKEGYQTRIRRYVVIWIKEVSYTRIELSPGKGEKIIDERKHRRHFQFPD